MVEMAGLIKRALEFGNVGVDTLSVFRDDVTVEQLKEVEESNVEAGVCMLAYWLL